MTASSIYDNIADFIAGLNPKKVLEMRPEPEMQARLEALMEKETDKGLSAEEKDELDHYIVLERLIRLAKSRANLRLKQS